MTFESAITPSQLNAQLSSRYATKSFDPNKKIPNESWAALESALHLSPSSFGLQPWAFFNVSDRAKREELKASSWNQPQITDASHLVVFAIRNTIDRAHIDRFIEETAKVRNQPVDSLAAYKDMMVGSLLSRSPEQLKQWATHQVYIALGFFLSSAAMLGIDACPMEGFDAAAYDSSLKLTEAGYHAVVLATAGYRADGDKYASVPKVRFASNEIIRSL